MHARISGLTFAFLCLLTSNLKAQSTEADIKARLIDKPLYLRGMYQSDNLRFDATGHLTSNSSVTAFTLSGFDLDKVTFKNDKLLLEGRRAALEFEDDTPRRIPLNIGKPKEQKDERIRIEIAAPSNGDYTAALDTIFANSLAQMAPSMPEFWQPYARKNFYDAHTPAPAQQHGVPNAPLKKIGGGLTPPQLLHQAEPSFTNAARHLRYSGIIVINLHVGPDGLPTHISIVRPLGMGLDENAIAAVQQYTFAPATQDGQPITIEMNIEVNFHIF